MLKFLNILNNPLESEGVEEIARALNNNNNLTSLHLSYIQLGPEELANGIYRNTTLTLEAKKNYHIFLIDLELKKRHWHLLFV